jgi:peptidyl-dipeptidase A
MLMKGSSEPWPDVLEAMTGSRKADPSAILEYFLPLSDWLDEQIAANDIPVGWTSTFEQWIE